MDILGQILWGNTLADWFLALVIAVAVFFVLNILKHITFRRALVWVRKTRTDLDDLVIDLFGRTWYLFLVAISIYTGSFVLTLPEIESGLRTVLAILFLAQAAIWGNGIINYLVSRQAKEQIEKDASAATTINALGFTGRLLL